MTADRDATRIVRSWLDEGVTVLPDRVLDAVLDQIPTTSQRRATGWPVRRYQTVSKIVGIGIAVAAAVIVAAIGFQLIRGGNVGSPVPSSSAPSSSSAGPVNFTDLESGGTELQPGAAYLVDYAAPVAVTFTVPDGAYAQYASHWFKALFDWGPWHQSNQARVAFLDVANVFIDPCDPSLGFLNPPPGARVDDLAAVLATLPGLETEPATPTTVDGYSGVRIEGRGGERPEDCVGEPMMWESSAGESSFALPSSTDRLQIYILDVEGSRLVIWVLEQEGLAETDQVQQLLDSVQISPG
jgi:hypothetical protein